MKINDLSNNQAVIYNHMTTTFQQQFNPDGFERLGQGFYNFYYGSVFTEPYPVLFYCEDNSRVKEMIEEALVDYIMEHVK